MIRQELVLGGMEAEVAAQESRFAEARFAERFWQKDAGLWPGGDPGEVGGMLGWIDVVPKMKAAVTELATFAEDVRGAGFTRAILGGMGGSSLAPYVMAQLFGHPSGISLSVLDSTHPRTVREIAEGGDLASTLVLIASKSGSTAEPTAFDAYLADKVGRSEALVAITDPGSPFHKLAESRSFRRIFLNFADIGGRFSALSYFGLVPAALLGLDVSLLLERAQGFSDAHQVGFGDPFRLGAAMGVLAQSNVDKLTILTSPRLASFGLWLEQLVAESTGKSDTGILPIAGERFGAPTNYGPDRFFAVIRLANDDNADLDAAISALRESGHPIAVCHLEDEYDLGAEMLRWEIATAVAGAVLGINPFDQPNVQLSKDVTKRLLAAYEKDGALPKRDDAVEFDGVVLYGEAIADSLTDAFSIFFGDLAPQDFVALQAFLPESPELSQRFADLQAAVRDASGLATTFGYGPRFLHSTGQYHKGGRNGGFFIQFVDRPTVDDAIPGHAASWATFVAAQAQGDAEALREKGRRVLTLDLGEDAAAKLPQVHQAIITGLARRER